MRVAGFRHRPDTGALRAADVGAAWSGTRSNARHDGQGSVRFVADAFWPHFEAAVATRIQSPRLLLPGAHTACLPAMRTPEGPAFPGYLTRGGGYELVAHIV